MYWQLANGKAEGHYLRSIDTRPVKKNDLQIILDFIS